MKNKFTLGAVAGLSTIALSVPLLTQLSFAQSASPATSVSASVDSSTGFPTRPAPTQADVQTMIDRDNAFLANIDAAVTLEKSTTQAHITALTAAAAITDETARETAVKKANDDQRAAIDAAITATPDLKAALRFGGGHGGPGGRGHGPSMDDLAQKLSMTADELKAALDSGKTIEQIAAEKGITLPAQPMMGMRGNGMLEQKLGMSHDEIKTALDSGKTIEQLAQEKGVTLPARPSMQGTVDAQASSAQ